MGANIEIGNILRTIDVDFGTVVLCLLTVLCCEYCQLYKTKARVVVELN
jgi:hypothetical protein